jgi:hypothetical protein
MSSGGPAILFEKDFSIAFLIKDNFGRDFQKCFINIYKVDITRGTTTKQTLEDIISMI